MQTNYVAKYTAAAMDAYIKYAETKYAETKDARDAAMYKDRAAAQVEAAHLVVAQPVALKAPAKVEKPRCPHWKAIKTFMAIAREHGLDTTAKDRCRGAVGALLGRRIESRADLTGAEWQAMGAAIKAGKLCW